MKNAEIISEEIIPDDVWEALCKKFGAKQSPRVRFDHDEGKLVAYEDDSFREFRLQICFVGNRMAFEWDRDAFLEYMEATFHDSVSRAMKNMREELNRLRSQGQNNVVN